MNREEHKELMKQMFSKSKEEIEEMFNSGMFNEIVKGYVAMLLVDYNFEENEQMEKALHELDRLFDEVTAGEARQYYRNY